MKKVVLLTGALAAGLAATSLNANASVPVAPNVQETNASDQQVAEMKYETYHGIVSRAFSGLYDLKTEFENADIDKDAKKEILADIEKRRLELSSNIEDLEKAYDAYQPYRDNAVELPAKLAALNTELDKFEALIEAGTVVLPNETQIKTNLRDRYNHVAKDWKIYKDNVTRGYNLLAAFQDLMGDQYKQIDEIEDVKAAKKAVEDAHEDLRIDNEKYHADRWYLDDANNWGPVADDHTTKACCVDKEADLETLYQTLVTKKGDFETLLNKYYKAKETLTSKLETSNQAETAALTADPATYTESVDGKAWVKAAQQKVNDAQKAAEDFIKTYNAANPAVWSNPASVDQLKGEDGKDPAFKMESEYERIANELITAVDNAIKDLDAAVKEAKANQKAYEDGLKALADRQKELDDIKTAYADKNKEFTTGKVYEQVIKAEQDKINNAKTDLTTAWNTWTDKALVPVDPKNAVEHVAGVTKDNVIYGQLKQDIADLLTKIQKNEAANDKIHEMTEALNGHYNEVKNAVAGYEDVALSEYAADGLCAHGEYLGTTSLDNLLKKFIEDEQKKYDAIESDAYLADTTENGPTAKKDALDHELEMTWNAIATDQCAKYLAKVEDEYNDKHSYCEGLDDVCNEVEGEGAPCTCTEEDREANPCGWCDATARGMHDAIETAKSEMDGKIQDWHFATDAKNHVAEVKTYKDKAFTDIENWVNAFKDADRLHDKNLDDLKVVVDKAVHNVHELYADARHDLDNYKEADLAAANLWAQDKYSVDFKGYVQLLEELYETAQVAADDARAKHHFTDLKAVGTECDTYATESDYRDAVKKNTVDYNANESVLGDLETRLASIVLNDNVLYGDDHTTLDAEYQRIAGLIDTARADASTAYNAGKAGEYTVPAEIATAIAALQVAVKNAEILYAANVAAKAELNAQLDAFQATVNAIELNEDALYADDYTTLDGQLGDLNDAIDTVRGAIDAAFNAKTAPEYSLPTSLASDLAALKVAIKNAENLHAANVAAKAELNAQLDAFQATVNAIELNEEALYADDYTTLDGQLGDLNDAIDTVRGEIDAAFNAKTAPEYSLPTSLAADLAALKVAIKNAENLFANNKAAFAKISTLLDNYETELRAIARDAESVYGETASEKDLAHLDAERDKIADMIDALRSALATAFDGKTAIDFETEKGEDMIAVNTELEKFRQMVADYEEFKRQNFAEATKLYNDLTNLQVVAEGLKNYGPVYEEGVEGGYDKESIDREIADLERSLKGEISFLKQALEAGEVVDNLESYEAGLETYKQDVENIKADIEYAEQLYAANYRALNNLEEHIKAVETVLHTTKAMCACNECNEEDMEAVQGHLDTLAGILDAVNESFSDTKDLAMQEGAFSGQIEAVEVDAANLLALIQLHLDTAQNDLRVYNTLQALLANTVDAEMLKLEAEEGYKCFANRDAYHNEDYNPERPHFHDGATTNPNVKYGNELTQMVEDLKAEIDRQHSHEGGHTCEENKLADVKAMNDIVAEIQKTIAAVKANEAAHKLLQDRFEELFEDAKDAYNFWHQYYSIATLITHEGDIANWIQEWNGELENGYVLAGLENLLHDYYVHGNAANAWTVDGKGEELNEAANNTFAEKDADLAKDRNELAHTEALNHYAKVKEFLDTYKNSIYGAYTEDGFDDPFVKGVLVDWREEVEGEYGLFSSLNYYKEQIELAYEEKVMEDAINIDEHNTALGIHQQLDGVLAVLAQIEAEYAVRFEDAHHLTNGKTIYSDQEYFTLGFFEKANDGLGNQGQEMFKTVDILNQQNIWIEDESDEDKEAYVSVLTNGAKSNELSFNLKQVDEFERTTLKAGKANVQFAPGSIRVVADQYGNWWTTKHQVSIDGIEVASPVETVAAAAVAAASNKLIVRLDAPIDLTYTINSLVARTDDGTEFSYADRVINYAAGQLEFDLPAGTQTVELPEGFFTFRTGENSIVRSAAMTVNVAGVSTSIEALIAMGEKAQIFDLQGRRVKAEALISGNTYVVNGEKVMVK